jgi:hypothetical protein
LLADNRYLYQRAFEGDELILSKGMRGIFYFGIFSKCGRILMRESLRVFVIVSIAGIRRISSEGCYDYDD